MSRVLVAYYSSSGRNRTLAEAIAVATGADLEAIQSAKSGPALYNQGKPNPIAFMVAGVRGWAGLSAPIRPPQHDPAAYDLLVVCTPAYAGGMPGETRSYLTQVRSQVQRVAFVSCSGDANQQGLFRKMERVLGLAPVATLSMAEETVDTGRHVSELQELVLELRRV